MLNHVVQLHVVCCEVCYKCR